MTQHDKDQCRGDKCTNGHCTNEEYSGETRRADRLRETPMTYEEYANLPEDGNRYELVDGQLELMSPAPSLTHQMISSRLLSLLSRDCDPEYEIISAPVDIVLSNTEVRQPDLVMIHLSRLPIYKERGKIDEPPDLVVEILSRHSLKRDKVAKRKAYAKFGVPEYWIVNPEDESLEQHLLGPNGSYDLADVYTGDEPIRSDRLKCVSFSMNAIMSRVKNLPEA
ncbi:MAG: Uma2 family endonuclease [Alicyclobacillus herbarius]|nr:Uma2 family endonuclease [Alicyclobacillus herbarius]